LFVAITWQFALIHSFDKAQLTLSKLQLTYNILSKT